MSRDLETWSRLLGNTPADSIPETTVYPPLNVSEDADNIYVRAELAGIPATQLEIFVEGETLTIKGNRSSRPAQDKVSYHRREIARGAFNRALNLPQKVEGDKVTAKAGNGIVTITLPKAEETKPRQIKVNVA
jgi:HSP20 family protein